MGSTESATDLPGGRDAALELLHEYTKKPGLIKHALAVEAACRTYAEKHGADPDAWGLVGLLHDFDYERWPTPEDHPFRGSEILAERGYPEWFRRAILSHANYSGVARESLLEKTLFACDELSGFLTACALVTPARSLHDVKVKSVRKKMKSKAFAASVSREDIIDGAEGLGVDLNEHIEFVLGALRGVADELELGGQGAP
ncbi:MAG: HDIG domain-containing protein [Acidobacteria bacterium]|nr:HDIG domain-containing protein [Acidobacteriota bacterium]NIM63481.1 HDIG domain-containing protein [Acidobacteriota bacterium]NIO60909.1 HDIG domain-containing protein [Acidobacteriota bacterium]NIQ31101.1 HDIG domain-containing protein [Acidobacteriota bacterium]NIQ87370.1 HDIG domain-containing protein [Acidobacteriota bacterium]